MKAALVLCLLVFISCQKDIIDIGKCIYKAPKIKDLIADAMIAFTTKDFSKLWPKIKEAIPELIHIVIGCVSEKKAVEEEYVLKKSMQECAKLCRDASESQYFACWNRCRES